MDREVFIVLDFSEGGKPCGVWETQQEAEGQVKALLELDTDKQLAIEAWTVGGGGVRYIEKHVQQRGS